METTDFLSKSQIKVPYLISRYQQLFTILFGLFRGKANDQINKQSREPIVKEKKIKRHNTGPQYEHLPLEFFNMQV